VNTSGTARARRQVGVTPRDGRIIVYRHESLPIPPRPKELYLAHRVPYPPDKGDRIRNYHVLAWLSKLAARFGVELSPHVSLVFDEISGRCFGGITLADVGERATLPPRAEEPPAPAPKAKPTRARRAGKGLRLVAYRPLFSGAAVERTPELAFQRPEPEVWLAPEDARKRKIRNGATVTVTSNGTSAELRARIARDLAPGVVRIPDEHAEGLHETVEVTA